MDLYKVTLRTTGALAAWSSALLLMPISISPFATLCVYPDLPKYSSYIPMDVTCPQICLFAAEREREREIDFKATSRYDDSGLDFAAVNILFCATNTHSFVDTHEIT